MEAIEKLALLSGACDSEADDGDIANAKSVKPNEHGIVLSHACLPNGRRVTLLKSLLTSVCENDCLYCAFRSARDCCRETFHPLEFADLVMRLTRAGLIQGLFISSGVAGGGARTQERLIETAEILRKHMGYTGYIHLKVMPGAVREQVQRSMRLADRISINLEAPNATRLAGLAPRKQFDSELMQPLGWMKEIRERDDPVEAWKRRWPSSSTQFVVGGAGESDRELLQTSQVLHRAYGLQRIYYSAFKPHEGTPLESHSPSTYRRELRLYQADYLLRDYGFSEEEFDYAPDGSLPESRDPKLAWAERNLRSQPLELNTAPREALLRVPGIGPKSAERIIRARRMRTLNGLAALEKLGIQAQRAAAFVLLDGRQPDCQLRLI